ncbi:hypothetical protein EV421DRAFT_1929670 [Armillaria borealis]|uniref:Uncharacterized protein n=1 Tax=Armillaria borealis TaxID=47425 RepID=A0AA39MF53_9AGAR|nr:hypothetical protein EV421DRAFT_1929670 [Armillaria borealis]
MDCKCPESPHIAPSTYSPIRNGMATPSLPSLDLPVLETVPEVDPASLVVQPLPTADGAVVEAVSAALLSPTSMTVPSPPIGTAVDLMDTPSIRVLETPEIRPISPPPPPIPAESASAVGAPVAPPPSSSSRGLSRGQGSAVWSARLAARAKEKEVHEKGKERDLRGTDASNYASLGLGIHVKGESAGTFRDRTVNNESTVVGALVEVKDELKHHTAEHAEQYDMTLRELADTAAVAKLADDTAKQAAATAAVAARALPPITDAINRSLKTLQITTSALQSHSTAIQSHSQAIIGVQQEVVGVRDGLQDLRMDVADLQRHISTTTTAPRSAVPVTSPGNPSLIRQQPPTNITSPAKRSRGNNGRQINRTMGSRAAPIVIQDSLTAAPVQCPPLSDTPSHSVIFTVSRLDQDAVEASRRVAGAIPGVGTQAIAEVVHTTVCGSALVRFRSKDAAKAFVQLLRHRDAMTQLGATAAFALLPPSPQQISPLDNALNNVHDILSNPVQGN